MKTLSVFFMSMLITSVLTSCSSGRSVKYTMNDTDRPKWAREDVGFYEDGRDLVFVGIFETKRSSDLNMNAVRKASDMKVWDQVSLKIKSDYAADVGMSLEDLRGDEKFNNTSRVSTQAVMENTGIAGRWYHVIEDQVDDEEFELIQHFSTVRIPRTKFMKLVRANNQ